MDNELSDISDAKASKTLRGDNQIIAISTMQANYKRLIALARVDAALERLEAGTFGLCTECGGEIDIEDLVVNPAVTSCSDCIESTS